MICFSPCVRYMSELFYIGPIYHLAFTKLDKMIMLDSTDLGVLSDLEVHISCPLTSTVDIETQDLWSEFSKLESSEDSLLAVGLDLAPHYFNQVIYSARGGDSHCSISPVGRV